MFSLRKEAVPPKEAEYTVKLVELLETGNHDYPWHLISTLHAMQFPRREHLGNGDGEVGFEATYVEGEEDDSGEVEDSDEFIRRRR